MSGERNTLTGGSILELMGGFRPSCILGAAAELGLFDAIGQSWMSAEEVAAELESDLRATRMLLDAIAAIGLLSRDGDRYSVPAEVRALLTEGTPQTVLPMVRHNMTVLRNWAQLAWIVKAGILAPRQASIRGFEADRAAFIAAMHSVSGPIADGLVAKLVAGGGGRVAGDGGRGTRDEGRKPATRHSPPATRLLPPAGLRFEHLLDVGGASGTWTLAFLRAIPEARATIFDLPDAIAQARQRIGANELADRVDFAAGDFYCDELPAGADFAWVSAIIHQHSREDSRELFAKVFRALQPGGRIGIRDIVMEPCRTRPPFGALFAINMLAGTERGGTYTFQEIAEDLRAAGFTAPELRVKAEDMTSVVVAAKPGVGRL